MLANRYITAALLLLSLSACGRYRRTAPVDIMELGPTGTLQRAVEMAGDSLPMRVRGTLQIQFGGGSMTGQTAVLYAEPDSVRIDVTAFLGSVLLEALVIGRSAVVHSPMEKVVLEGTLGPGELLEVGGFPFDLGAVREWVLGPAIARDWVTTLDAIDQFDIGVHDVVIGMTLPQGQRLTVRLDDELYFREAKSYDPEGRLLWETTYASYDRVRGNRYPDLVTVRYPSADMVLTVNVTRRTIDPRRGPDDFRLTIPSGTQRLVIRGRPPAPVWP